MNYGPVPAAYRIDGRWVICCLKCSGTGLLTDGEAFQRQVCTTDEDCLNCGGVGRVPYPTQKKDAS